MNFYVFVDARIETGTINTVDNNLQNLSLYMLENKLHEKFL